MNNQLNAVQTFQALGDASRYHIVKLLSRDQDLCVSEVAKEIGVTTAAISQHMKVLERAGLVKPRRSGQKTCYQLNRTKAGNRVIFELIN